MGYVPHEPATGILALLEDYGVAIIRSLWPSPLLALRRIQDSTSLPASCEFQSPGFLTQLPSTDEYKGRTLQRPNRFHPLFPRLTPQGA